MSSEEDDDFEGTVTYVDRSLHISVEFSMVNLMSVAPDLGEVKLVRATGRYALVYPEVSRCWKFLHDELSKIEGADYIVQKLIAWEADQSIPDFLKVLVKYPVCIKHVVVSTPAGIDIYFTTPSSILISGTGTARDFLGVASRLVDLGVLPSKLNILNIYRDDLKRLVISLEEELEGLDLAKIETGRRLSRIRKRISEVNSIGSDG